MSDELFISIGWDARTWGKSVTGAIANIEVAEYKPPHWYANHTDQFIVIGVEPCDFVKMLLEQFPAGTVTLAGGAARSVYTKEPVVDYDLWMPGCDVKERCYDLTYGPLKAKAVPTVANNLINMNVEGRDVQLCYSEFGYQPQQLISTFDFTLCMFAIQRQIVDGASCYALTTTAQALSDAHKKILRMWSLQYPVDTLRRIPKYVARGWQADFDFYHELFQHLQTGVWNKNKLTPHSDESYGKQGPAERISGTQAEVMVVDDYLTKEEMTEAHQALLREWHAQYVNAPFETPLEDQRTKDSRMAGPADVRVRAPPS